MFVNHIDALYIFPMKILYKYLLIFLQLVLLVSCDKGIAPATVEEENQTAGFSGTITFVGTWPDSVKWTLLVVFKEPLSSPESFNVLNVGYIGHPIPTGTSVYNYSTLVDTGFIPITAGSYSYIAVAQSKNPNLTVNRNDWKVVGVYYANNDTTKPGALNIPNNTLVGNINIECNFNNPPPQPPGGN